MTAPAAARRDRFGRRFYPVPHPETHEIYDLPSWTRLKGILHSGGLETWKLKSVAKQIALKTDLQMLAGDDANTYQAVQQALDASRSKSNIGTAIHRFTEYVDAGTLDYDVLPEAAKPWVDQYRAAKARFGWTMVETEVSVYNLEVGYAGTADRFVNLPGVGVVAIDLKTGEHVWAETALQLGAYAYAEGIWTPPQDSDLPEYAKKLAELERDIAAGEHFKDWGSPRARKWSEDAKKKAYASLDELYWDEFALWPGHRPMPEGLRLDLGFVVHLGPQSCELVPVKLDGTPSTLDAVRGLCWIFQWQQRDADIVGAPLGIEGSADGTSGSGPGRAADGGSDGSDRPVVSEPGPAPDQQGARNGPEEVLGRRSQAESAERSSASQQGSQVRGSKSGLDPDADWLVARILALPETPRHELAARWPEGVPTFKTSRDHSLDQLRSISELLWDIEGRHELPFVEWSPGMKARAYAAKGIQLNTQGDTQAA